MNRAAETRFAQSLSATKSWPASFALIAISFWVGADSAAAQEAKQQEAKPVAGKQDHNDKPKMEVSPNEVRKPAPSQPLPEKWNGHWKGTLRLMQGRNDTWHEIPMELRIAPVPGKKACTWTIVYGKQERKYELLEGQHAGDYVVDEKNGLLLDSQLLGDTLYCQFSVTGVIVSTRYTHTGKTIDVEMMSTKLDAAKETKTKDGNFVVKSYPLVGMQSAKLERVTSSPK